MPVARLWLKAVKGRRYTHTAAMHKRQDSAFALRACIGHVAQVWRRASSPHSWAALGSTSKKVRQGACHHSHLAAIYDAAVHIQLAAKLDPAVVAAVAAHPTSKELSAEVRKWRVDVASAAGASPELLHVFSSRDKSSLNFEVIIGSGLSALRAILKAGFPVNCKDRF